MGAIAEIEAVEESWSDERVSGVGPINLTIRLWAYARDLREQGDIEGARDAALDATAVWAVDPTSLDEEMLIELLDDVFGTQAQAILGAVRSAPSIAAWKPPVSR